jgi:hypothetical protein
MKKLVLSLGLLSSLSLIAKESSDISKKEMVIHELEESNKSIER